MVMANVHETKLERDQGSAPEASAAWLSRDLEVGIGVFILALGLRLWHLREIAAADPYFFRPAVDGSIYHDWAQRIAEGDWIGQGVLIMGPLYPYLMGGVYSLVGPDLMIWKILQALLGAVSCVLVWWLAREVFDRRIALLAGLFAVFFEMLIFYGGTVMVVNVQVPLVLGVAIASVKSLRDGNFMRWLGVGVLIGLAALARQTMLLYVPLIALALWFSLAAGRVLPSVERANHLAALVLGVGLMLLPFTIRNLMVADDFVIVNSTGGMNLYMGNNADTDGRWRQPKLGRGRVDTPIFMQKTFAQVAEARSGRSLSPSEVSSYWTGEAIDFVRSDPLGWLWLEGRKFLLFVNADEVWNNRSIEISRPFSLPLRWSFLDLGIIMPLGLLGMGLAFRHWRELFPLYAVVAVYLASALIFFVVSRYRMPAVPMLMIFAAYSIVWFFDGLRGRSLRSFLAACIALVILVPVTRLHLAVPDAFMAYFNLANRYRENGDYPQAVEAYKVAIAKNPGFTSSLNNLALLYQELGQDQDAGLIWQALYKRALRTRDPVLLERAQRRLGSLGLKPEEANLVAPGEG